MKIFSLLKYQKFFIKNSKQALVIKPPVSQTMLNHRNIEGIRIPIYKEQQPSIFEKTDKYNAQMFDDKKTENCLEIQVEKQNVEVPRLIQEAQEFEIPFFLEPFQKAPEKRYIFETFKLKTTVKKASPVLKNISGCHIFEAIQILKESQTKVARYLVQELTSNGKKFLEENGLNLKRVYITQVLTHRVSRTTKINYHAKARFGIRKTDHCIFKFFFSEKPMKEFYKLLIQGKTPVLLSYLLKQHLVQTNADFNEIKKVQLLINGKGKFVQKQQFLRRCLKKHGEYKLKGFSVPFDTIKEYMLEKEANEFDEKYGYLVNIDEKLAQQRIETRKELLKNAKL